ncbi:hypothetical protein CPB83DRAFT_645587 [Crepidotus variabilis]|uniref:Uncharacterized protein n=1 Tax=Crepidotus variabilis TaxID=179855 RepID=A0A9P6E7Q6_9AGAR|nr:hypothetical protein CPB83DRAFT_645587 [Crepidotus variabilis]
MSLKVLSFARVFTSRSVKGRGLWLNCMVSFRVVQSLFLRCDAGVDDFVDVSLFDCLSVLYFAMLYRKNALINIIFCTYHRSTRMTVNAILYMVDRNVRLVAS